MLRSLASLFADLTGTDAPASPFDDDDHRLAAAALLVHLVAADGGEEATETKRILQLLRERFDLDAERADELLAAATARHRDAVDIYSFTSVLNRALSEEDRLHIVEMMWDVVFADGDVHEIEDNLVWRAADLLHVPARDRLRLKQAAAERAAGVREKE